MTRRAAFFLFPFCLFALMACSGKPPSLLNLKWYIVDRPIGQKERLGQTMSLFAAVQDPDGIEDLEEFYLINDSSRLYWKLTSDTWEKTDQDETTWIGSNGFALPSGNDFPDGVYRIIIIDSGGDRAEREITVNQANQSDPGEVFLSLNGDLLDIRGPFPGLQILVMDANDRCLLSLGARQGGQSLKNLFSSYPEFVLGKSIIGLSVSEGSNRAVMSRRITLP